jgi:RsiW-degrading membrane proteinase PrsW (M82 family)
VSLSFLLIKPLIILIMPMKMSLDVVKLIIYIISSATETSCFCAISRILFYARSHKTLSVLVGFLIRIKIFARIFLLSLASLFSSLSSLTIVRSYNTLINADIFCSFIVIIYYPGSYFVRFKFVGTVSPYILS